MVTERVWWQALSSLTVQVSSRSPLDPPLIPLKNGLSVKTYDVGFVLISTMCWNNCVSFLSWVNFWCILVHCTGRYRVWTELQRSITEDNSDSISERVERELGLRAASINGRGSDKLIYLLFACWYILYVCLIPFNTPQPLWAPQLVSVYKCRSQYGVVTYLILDPLMAEERRKLSACQWESCFQMRTDQIVVDMSVSSKIRRMSSTFHLRRGKQWPLLWMIRAMVYS